MIDRPGLSVRVERAPDWTATGPMAERAVAFARRFVETLPAEEHQSFRVTVERCPPQHSGLGVGTQLALAIAKAIAVELGHSEWPAIELAKRAGRGERSAIGIHGFDRGGLIVEGGKLPGEIVSPLVARFEFPCNWSVVLLSPPVEARWHGSNEREAFTRLTHLPTVTNQLCRIAITGLIPAVVRSDLELFGEALYEFNALAGDAFAPVQGGRYSSPIVADCIRRLRAFGVCGVGQSSWGPTIFAIVNEADADQVRRRFHDFAFTITNASTGAAMG